MNPDPENNQLSRRQFLHRLTKAGVSITAACAAGFWFYDSKGPPAAGKKGTTPIQFDFAIDDLEPKMSIVQGEDRAAALQAALKSLGGIESFVKKGDRVLLKVNAAFATPAMLSATTHPAIVTEMAKLCFKAGAASVVVTDNPINDPSSCFALTGIEEAARSAGAEVILPRHDLFSIMTLKDAKLIRSWPVLNKPFKNITKVIGMAPLKDHHRSGASMTMKNWYGLLGGRRNIFHQNINDIIKELAMMIKPTFVVLDATTTMMTNGPTGGSLSDLKDTHTMIVSTDQVAADAFGASLLGRTLDQVPFIRKAEALGAGTADYRKLNPIMTSIGKSPLAQ
ncbi:Tat pathway signal sequence domain protein [delta proteobacterium NaphS2]|nr:Tat pathway signal sequence domain protein [delta proteobacterium NaphS2]